MDNIIPGEYGSNNKIIGEPSEQSRCTIKFYGENSIVTICENVKCYNVHIDIYSNSVLYIKNNCVIRGSIMVHDFCSVVLNKGVRCNGNLNIRTAEKTKVIIGDECLISSVTIRSSDMHPIFDINSNQRINFGKDVIIGKHVWFCENTFVVKGVSIGDGSVVGAHAVVTKNIPSNVVVAGNPAIIRRTNIRWSHKL